MDFSSSVAPGEAMGLVGESAAASRPWRSPSCATSASIGRIVGGSIRFKGRDLGTMSDAELRQIRGSEIAMIYQEPMASLNPAMKVGRQLMEVPMIHEGASEAEAYAQALRVVEAVRLPDPKRIIGSYPHQLSGGQQQRIVIAMALMSKPALLILDEPTTALDVTVEAGIVELVKDLGREFGTSMIFICHNLGLVLETCDRICVMYSGEAVETGPIAEVFDRCATPIPRACSAPSRCPAPTAPATRWSPIPGQFPCPTSVRRAATSARAAAISSPGRCDAIEIPMEPVTPTHATRCIRWNEIDWARPPPPAKTAAARRRSARWCSTVDDLQEILRGRRQRALRRRHPRRQGQRVRHLRGARGRDPGHRRRVRLRQVDPRQGAARPRDRDRRHHHPRQQGDRRTRRSSCATSAPSPRSRWSSRTPSTPSTPAMSVGGQIIRALEKFGVGTSNAERAGADVRAPRPRQAAPRLRRPHAAPALRRPEAAHRHRPRLRRRPAGRRRRRAGLRPRRLGAGRGHRASDRHPARPTARRMLFISHDLGIVRYLADRVMVMYLGHVVEIGTTDQVFAPPYHPYTEALLSAIPIADTSVVKEHIVLEGDIPSAVEPAARLPLPDPLPAQAPGAGQPLRHRGSPLPRARPRPPRPVPPAGRGPRHDAAGDPRPRGARPRGFHTALKPGEQSFSGQQAENKQRNNARTCAHISRQRPRPAPSARAPAARSRGGAAGGRAGARCPPRPAPVRPPPAPPSGRRSR